MDKIQKKVKYTIVGGSIVLGTAYLLLVRGVLGPTKFENQPVNVKKIISDNSF